MADIITLSTVGGGAIGWARASLARMRTLAPLFMFERLSSWAMLIIGTAMVTRAVLSV